MGGENRIEWLLDKKESHSLRIGVLRTAQSKADPVSAILRLSKEDQLQLMTRIELFAEKGTRVSDPTMHKVEDWYSIRCKQERFYFSEHGDAWVLATSLRKKTQHITKADKRTIQAKVDLAQSLALPAETV